MAVPRASAIMQSCMPGISESVLNDIVASVARRVASPPRGVPSAGYVLLALSGDGPQLRTELDRIASSGQPVLAVVDCVDGSAGALAVAHARIPELATVLGEEAYDAPALVGAASRVVAPSMDLALASRVVSMQADSPAARVIVRALLSGGVCVEGSLDRTEFAVSECAAVGTRNAVLELVRRLRELGVDLRDVSGDEPADASQFVDASQERFTFPESLDELVEVLENRPCTIEVGKACVACGACEARGF